MSHDYRMVTWTPFKKSYDRVLAGGVSLFLVAYVAAALMATPAGQSNIPIQLGIRALGACAFGLLTFILAIGPLARLSPRFLPLLYNRRHLGVTFFLLGLVHFGLVLLWYHGFSDQNPLVSLLASNPRYGSIQGFPFESLGLLALLVLFVMAATSHDFWNANLGPRVWKAIHMSVYFAYALLVGHVMLGAAQTGKSLAYPIVVGAGAGVLTLLHIAAARVSAHPAVAAAPHDGWLRVGPALEIADGRASILTPPEGERIAVFRSGDRVFAISNVCRHQGGPLGEGRIVDGCVTCPWHGFQYRPEDGCAPPPFTERVATYRTRIDAGIVFVDPTPSTLGAATPPSVIGAST